jgi:REP element-mobilizing transposase RayT
MGTYRQIYYQLVFGTKYREASIAEAHCEQLYKYIWGVLQQHKCFVYAINGVADHLHIVCDLHPTVCLADLVKAIKVSSSIWLKDHGGFPAFTNWQDGYGAFTYSHREKDRIIAYVKRQKEHHKVVSFREEYVALLKQHGVEYDERYLL